MGNRSEPAKRTPSTLYLLHQTGQAMRLQLDGALRAIGMTGVKYTILAIVEAEGASSADISRRLFVTPQTMSEIVSDLVERELVVRREDETTRRILRLRLTLKGRQMLAKCDKIATRLELEAFGRLSEDDVRKFRQLLGDLLSDFRSKSDSRGSAPAPAFG